MIPLRSCKNFFERSGRFPSAQKASGDQNRSPQPRRASKSRKRIINKEADLWLEVARGWRLTDAVLFRTEISQHHQAGHKYIPRPVSFAATSFRWAEMHHTGGQNLNISDHQLPSTARRNARSVWIIMYVRAHVSFSIHMYLPAYVPTYVIT